MIPHTPFSVIQVENINARKKGKQVDQFIQIMEYANEHPGTIQNLVWTPHVSFVYCPSWVLQNVVDACCYPNSKVIFCLDTTYNVGKFYVTPTTYTREGIILKRTGKPGTFPGPALFHKRRTNREFFSFAATLREINGNISNIRFIGGDRDDATKYFTHLMPGNVFLPCTKHVSDDIKRKLDDLHLQKKKEEYILQIFGSVKLSRKGLMDAVDEAQFNAEYKELSQHWDPRFTEYFEKNIKDDMVKGMLLSTREYLGIDRFYNNSVESMNFKYKNLIKEYIARTRGKVRTKFYDLSYLEAVQVYETLVNQHRSDLSTCFQHHGSYSITGFNGNWDDFTPTQKKSYLAKVDNYHKNPVLTEACLN